MIDFRRIDQAPKAAWVKRLHDARASKWCSMFSSAMSRYGGLFPLDFNFNIQELKTFVSTFYKGVLNVWQVLHSNDPSTANEFKMKSYGIIVSVK